jgi:hypothetical protein
MKNSIETILFPFEKFERTNKAKEFYENLKKSIKIATKWSRTKQKGVERVARKSQSILFYVKQY